MATQQLTGRQIKDGVVSNNHIAAGAAIASTKLASWSADRAAGGNKLTGLAPGTAATDAVTKSQLDSVATASAAGLAVKAPVRVASTANIAGTYSATGGTSARGQFTLMPNSVDGVSLAANDRVLLKDQSTGAQNGIWIVTTLGSGSNGVWDRATDIDGDAEVTDGTAVFVGEGTQATTQWVLTTNAPITVGGASGTALVFTQFGAGSVYSADETTLTLASTTFSIKNAGVGATQLATDAVTTAKINALAVTDAKLAADSVITAKILDGNVTTNKLAADAVTNAKLADNAVQQENLADNSVGTTEIIDANVTAAKLAADSVTTVKILDANVTTAKIADANVTLAKMAANSVDASKIVDGSVGASELGTDAVTTVKILDANVTLAKLAANSVDASKIVDGSVAAAELASDAVTTIKILDANVTAAKIATDAVTTVKIQANAVTGGKIAFIDQTVSGTVNGSNAAFTTSAAATPGSLIVWVNGVRNRPTTDFSYSGSTTTFTTAPETGDDIAVFGVTA
jgi:hypothetical protein